MGLYGALYQKWVSQGFEDSVLKYVAKTAKSKNKANFAYVDALLEKYYAQRLFSVNEINLYEEEKAKAKDIAKLVTRNLGLYYENLEPVVDNYIWNWLNLGFS